MSDKLRKLEYVLIFSGVLMFFSCLGLLMSSSDIDNLVKIIIASGVGILFVGLSDVFDKSLKSTKSSKFYWFSGIVLLFCNYLAIGFFDLFGSWFSLNGDGREIFLASVAVMASLLALVTYIKYKYYGFLHFIFFSLLMMISFILTFFNINTNIIFSVFVGVFLLFNIFSPKTQFSNFVRVISYIIAIMSIFMLKEELVSNILLVSLNIINLLALLTRYKDNESNILTLIIWSFLSLSLMNYLDGEFSKLTSFVIIAFVVSLIDLFVTILKIIPNRNIRIAFRIIVNLVLFWLVFNSLENLEALIINGFMVVVSAVNVFLTKRDGIEEILFPMKVILLITSLVTFFVGDFIDVSVPLIVIFINVISLILGALIRSKKFQDCLSMICLICCGLFIVYSKEVNILLYLANTILALVDYRVLLLNNENKNEILKRLFSFMVILLIVFGINNPDIEHFKYLIAGISLVGLIILSESDRLILGISIPILSYSIIKYIEAVVLIDELMIILSTSMAITGIILFAYYVFDKSVHRDIFSGIFLFLSLTNCLDTEYFIVIIFTLVISLAMIIWGIRDSDYKVVYYVGIVLGILSILSLFDYFGDVPMSIYLIIVGLLLISVVSIMIYRASKNIDEFEINIKDVDNVIEEEKPIKNVHNYCGNCGHKLNPTDKFCGNCGEVVSDD